MTARSLPHSTDAEASVLGGILLRNELMDSLGDLDASEFYDPKHQAVFAAMRCLAEAEKPIDEVTLADELRIAGRLDAIGGVSFLSKLALKVPTTDNAEHYAAIVRDKHAGRALIVALSEALTLGKTSYSTFPEYQAAVLAKIQHVLHRATQAGPRLLKHGVDVLRKVIAERPNAPGGITGVPTGYRELDRQLAGLQGTDLIVLAARPSMGKTALALCIAKHAAERGHPVVVFSHEMSELQLVERLLCVEAEIATTAIRQARLRRRDTRALANALPHLSLLPLAIDDTPSLTHHQVAARARRFATQYGSDRRGLVVVDYLQLMEGSTRHGTREREIAEISRGMKALAKGLGWPVLALSQLNRSLESRTNKRPMLSDLRESGAIEQDADVVLFLYRDVVYNEDTAEPDIAELDIAKQRNGAVGTVRLRFEAQYTRFSNL